MSRLRLGWGMSFRGSKWRADGIGIIWALGYCAPVHSEAYMVGGRVLLSIAMKCVDMYKTRTGLSSER